MGIESQQTITRIVRSHAERAVGVLSSETVERASQRFRIDGALIIEDIVNPAIIATARRAFREAYSHYLDGAQHEDALMTGSRRVIITICLETPFDDPSLFC